MATPPHYRFWPRRLPHAIRPPQTSLVENLRISALRGPKRSAFVFFGRQVSYAEVWRQVEHWAGRLHTMGVRRGDRVVLNMQNCPQLVIAHFAILRANAVVVPVNPMNRAEELKHYITDPDARVALTTGDLAPMLAAASNALPPGQGLAHLIVADFVDAMDESQDEVQSMPKGWRDWLLTRYPLPTLEGGQTHAWQALMDPGPPPPPLEVGPDDMAALPYTSGTTGLPKGCVHLHSTIMHNAAAGAYWGNLTPENVCLVVVPMFHATGMVSIMHTCVFTGGTMVIMPRWDREVAGGLISRWKVTSWANIPTMVVDLLASPKLKTFDLSSLTHIGGGGAAMPQAVAQRLFEEFGLRYQEGYGLTETAAPSHSNPPEAPKQQCLGIPYMGVDSRVVDPDTLAPMPSGQAGEILINGPMVFKGYWKRPDATAAAFVEIEGKSFFRSGDLGYVDEEGYFFLTDRLKRMINASGFKVWPAEVESLMYRHPAIQEACVIAAHDAYRGETVKAMVVLRASHRGQVSEGDIIDWCHANMAVYKAPRKVQFLDVLPKSGSGKVMWRTLQEAEQAQRATN